MEGNWNPTVVAEENTNGLILGITMVRRPCGHGDQWSRWWEVVIEPRIELRLELRVEHDDARRRTVINIRS